MPFSHLQIGITGGENTVYWLNSQYTETISHQEMIIQPTFHIIWTVL